MIVPKLVGRLGNQCFQVAAAIAHAKRMGTNYGLPPDTVDGRIWKKWFTHLFVGVYPRRVHKEPAHSYSEIPSLDHLTLDGYFQSEKYFADAKPEVAAALGFEYSPQSFVAMHVRRGDYLQFPDQFPVLPMEYYHTAIMECASRGHGNFIIFSDDIYWCRSHFSGHYWDDLYFAFSSETDPLIDLKNMFCAKAFIIANSSYSLFAASLRDDEPLVIAPAEHRWYGPRNAHLDTKDLMHERWIKI